MKTTPIKQKMMNQLRREIKKSKKLGLFKKARYQKSMLKVIKRLKAPTL